MTHTPSESEKRITAIVQAASAVLLFIPAFVVLRNAAMRKSPYVRYWAKVNMYWSLVVTIILVSTIFLGEILDVAGPAIILGVVHFLICITGAVSAYFNTPFQYWFIAKKFCGPELGDVYGQLVTPTNESADTD